MDSAVFQNGKSPSGYTPAPPQESRESWHGGCSVYSQRETSREPSEGFHRSRESAAVKVETLGAGRDSAAGCGYCGEKPFDAYRRYGLPVGHFVLQAHDMVVCGDCLTALKDLDSVGPVTLETLAVQHEGWAKACEGQSEKEIFAAVAHDLVDRIRFSNPTPQDPSERSSQASILMRLVIDDIRSRSVARTAEGSRPAEARP